MIGKTFTGILVYSKGNSAWVDFPDNNKIGSIKILKKLATLNLDEEFKIAVFEKILVIKYYGNLYKYLYGVLCFCFIAFTSIAENRKLYNKKK